MRAGIVVFPGSNRERDAAAALKLASGNDPVLLWHGDRELPKLDLILIPGGFAYGDYLRAGAMAAHSPIMDEVVAAAAKGVHVLGLCNGFQVLTERGLVPGALLRNASLSFVCREVVLERVGDSPFTDGYKRGDTLKVPVAHHDGNYFADADTLKRVEDEDRVAFRYAEGTNPNGSISNIAGVLSENRRVLGMMPHPENAIDPLTGTTDGKALFSGLARIFH